MQELLLIDSAVLITQCFSGHGDCISMTYLPHLAPLGFFLLLGLPAIFPLLSAWRALLYGRLFLALRFTIFPAIGLAIAITAGETVARVMQGQAPIDFASITALLN